MKVAILSDIHANIFALKKVLTEIKELKINKIFIAGDFIGYYFWPRETLNILEQFDIFAIKGNHEDLLFKVIDGKISSSQILKKYGSGLNLAIENLTEHHIKWLKALECSNKCILNGKKISMYHGAPWDPNFYVYPNSHQKIFERCFKEDADLIILGHTHYQMEIKKNKKKIINPGSIGQPRDGRIGAQWAVVNLENLDTEFKCSRYDNSIIKKEVDNRHKDMKILKKSLYEKIE